MWDCVIIGRSTILQENTGYCQIIVFLIFCCVIPRGFDIAV